MKESVSMKKIKLDKLRAISDYNDQCKEYQRMANDPVAFIEKYGMCDDPSKGYVPVQLYDHQKELLRSYHANDRNIVHHARQTGITFINALYAFHQAFFNRDYRVILTSNNLATSTEILDKIRPTYEVLPEWYKTGNRIVLNNKHEISFLNNSSVLVMPATADTLKGYHPRLIIADNYNCVTLRNQDEFYATACVGLPPNGKFIITSSGSYGGSIFSEIWHRANKGLNKFVASRVNWRFGEHDDDWKKNIVEMIGEKQWKVEYEVPIMIKDDHNGPRKE